MSVFRVILVRIFSAFCRIQTEYGEMLRISPYSVRMRENAGKMRTEITPYTDTFYAVTSWLKQRTCNALEGFQFRWKLITRKRNGDIQCYLFDMKIKILELFYSWWLFLTNTIPFNTFKGLGTWVLWLA